MSDCKGYDCIDLIETLNPNDRAPRLGCGFPRDSCQRSRRADHGRLLHQHKKKSNPGDAMPIATKATVAGLMALAVMFGQNRAYGQRLIQESAGVIADSVTEFSGEQGRKGWQYGYWDRSVDPDGKYNQRSDFKRLKHFGSDSRNSLWGRQEFTTGDLWFLEDGRFYTSLWAKGGHANSGRQLGDYAAAEQWAVRRWISDTAGKVTITGHAGKDMPWGANWAGECRAIIMIDGETVFSTVMDEHGLDYAIAAKVREKSVVDFLIAPDPSIGVVTFTATIRKRPENR